MSLSANTPQRTAASRHDSKWIWRLSAAAVLALGFGFGPGILSSESAAQVETVEKERLRLRQRIESTKRANRSLAAEVKLLAESPLFREWVVRQELGWVKPGDVVFRTEGRR